MKKPADVENVKFMIEVEFEGTDRDQWEFENKVLGLKGLNGVSKITFVEED